MGWPIVIVTSGGIPVTEVSSGKGTPVDVASNGFGTAVRIVASGGLPVVGSGGAVATLALDGITTGIKAAYSTRKLRTAYAGSALQVTRASDSAIQDIGFVANVLDTAALVTFCSGTTGKVTIWYDQGGGVFDMAQAAATAPTIYASGAVKTINSKPAILFTAATPTILATSALAADPVNVEYLNAVISVNSTAGSGAIIGGSNSGSLVFYMNAGGSLQLDKSNALAIGTSTGTISATTGAVVEAQYSLTSGAWSFWINRSLSGTGTTVTTFGSIAVQAIGTDNGTSRFMDGLIGETIIYDLVGGIPGASQTSITLNQKAYWGTP